MAKRKKVKRAGPGINSSDAIKARLDRRDPTGLQAADVPISRQITATKPQFVQGAWGQPETGKRS